MVKLSQVILIVISTLAANTLAKDCQCSDGSQWNTQACCDAWENDDAPGVHYSGTWDDVCRDPANEISVDEWIDCCAIYGVDGGCN